MWAAISDRHSIVKIVETGQIIQRSHNIPTIMLLFVCCMNSVLFKAEDIFFTSSIKPFGLVNSN